ncbi:MAG: hypothetical protein ACTFAL_10445 [Candidatus Electronema sp. V4]|uniref:hypothetical protein n=1 Tax=Candidatus Electronema sp. V4 TaxID=3454756 RepID=UPI004055693F
MTDLAGSGLDGQRQVAAPVSEPYLRVLRKHLFSSSPQKKKRADLWVSPNPVSFLLQAKKQKSRLLFKSLLFAVHPFLFSEK